MVYKSGFRHIPTVFAAALSGHGGQALPEERKCILGNNIELMIRYCPTIAITLSIALHATASGADSFREAVTPLIQSACIDCHDGNTDTRLNFEDLGHDLSQSETFRHWERVFDRVSSGEMPPSSESRPDPTLLKTSLEALRKDLHANSFKQQQTSGRVASRRLTRLEYSHTICDLLKIDESVRELLAEQLPAEADTGSFDTVANSQRISPLHIEAFLRAANLALTEAIQLGPRPESQRRLVDYPNASYLRTFNKKPLVNGGSNLKKLDDAVVMFLDLDYVMRSDQAGLKIETAGDYKITVEAYAYQADRAMTMKLVKGHPKRIGAELLGAFDLLPGHTRTISVVTRMEPGDYLYPSLRVAKLNTWSGLVAAGSAENYKGEGVAVKAMVVEGPLLENWPPASTKKLLPHASIPMAGTRATKEQVTEVVARIARLAFRRPVRDDEVASFVALAEPAIQRGADLPTAIRASLKSLLSSPQFLFFDDRPGELTDFALASRLSFGFWRSLPDEELFRLARDGQLSDPEVLRQQVERLLHDEKSMRFVRDFVGQWLRLDDIDATTPDRKLYPEYDATLRVSSQQETELFFAELVKQNLRVSNLIDSDFTFLNRRLAEHYRVEGVRGQEMRRVQLPAESVRGGILTQSSILKVTANGTFTSPVKRGAFVLTRLLGEPPDSPPPNVGSVEPDTRGATTIRETLEKHRHMESCARCHQSIDPPGFALENFDPIGGFRTHYRAAGRGRYRQGPVVDSSGVTPEGKAFRGIRSYKQRLLEQQDQVARNLIEQFIVYVTGAEIQFADREEVSRIAAATRDAGYPVRSIIHEVVQSRLMRNQ